MILLQGPSKRGSIVIQTSILKVCYQYSENNHKNSTYKMFSVIQCEPGANSFMSLIPTWLNQLYYVQRLLTTPHYTPTTVAHAAGLL